MELIDLPDFGPDDYRQVVDGEVDPFATEHLGIVWGPKTEHIGLTDGGRLVAHAGWARARADTGTGAVLDVVGLGSVIVHRSHRGTGAGSRLIAAAMGRMAGSGPIGMLFCRPDRLAFYERLGWARFDGTVTVDQPGGPIAMPLLTCWTALATGASVAATDLHVEGLPF